MRGASRILGAVRHEYRRKLHAFAMRCAALFSRGRGVNADALIAVGSPALGEPVFSLIEREGKLGARDV
jgi:hypothetical protein